MNESRKRHTIRRVLIAAWFSTLAAFAALMISPWSVSAASDAPAPPAADAGTNADSWLFSLDAPTVLVITAFVIPFLGGLILKSGASSNLKVAVNLVLNGANALVVAATTDDGGAIISQHLVTSFALSTAVSIASLYGFYKQVQVPDGGTSNVVSLDTKLKSIGGIVGSKAA